MDRQFGFPFFSPFFFPGRRFFPFFTFSPFFFPFFRSDGTRDADYFTMHTSQDGETLDTLAATYNVPRPVLEVMNPHVGQPHLLVAGSIVYVPRMDKVFCQRMYIEVDGGHPHYPQYPPAATPYTGYMPQGQPMMYGQ